MTVSECQSLVSALENFEFIVGLVIWLDILFSINKGPIRWLVLVLIWVGWCWFFVREKHCWLASLGWLKPTSEQAEG